ncbi:MAG: hypothetical protein JSW24_00870 [Dehalococcoidia bacterium]|nr:MAG: hypothetical protein JSW24_00870 [Dehalococcoidia bacterium]
MTDKMANKQTPIPVKLEKGEKEVRRVEGVKLSSSTLHRLQIEEDFLLLTNRRLIITGKFKSGEEIIPVAYMGYLDDVVSCEVKKAWFEPKKLSVTFREYSFKFGTQKVVKIWRNGEVYTSVDKVRVSTDPKNTVGHVETSFVGMSLVGLRSFIMAQLALQGVENYAQQNPWDRPRPKEFAWVFKDIEQPEVLKSDIMKQIETKRGLP